MSIAIIIIVFKCMLTKSQWRSCPHGCIKLIKVLCQHSLNMILTTNQRHVEAHEGPCYNIINHNCGKINFGPMPHTLGAKLFSGFSGDHRPLAHGKGKGIMFPIITEIVAHAQSKCAPKELQEPQG